MFEQVIGDGANLFILIVAVIIGFVGALGYVDFQKTKKEENQQD
jgi:predicted negative regulator of RcsB-dependent stress response